MAVPVAAFFFLRVRIRRSNDYRAANTFLSAHWRHAVRDTNVTEAFEGRKLIRKLLQLRRTDNPALREQVAQLDADIARLDRDIDAAERAMNAYVYDLYGLTEEEIRLVEAG